MDSNNKTVLLNVGGTKYEVSRSLIEQHPETMLARLVSDRWQQDCPDNEIFIDRNGPRFQYVLDYMRDRKAYLPVGIAKPSLLQEFEYFGFEGISDDAIHESYANYEAAAQVASCCESARKTIQNLEVERKCSLLAIECYKHFSQTGNFSGFGILQAHQENKLLTETVASVSYNNEYSAMFNKCLAKIWTGVFTWLFSRRPAT